MFVARDCYSASGRWMTCRIVNTCFEADVVSWVFEIGVGVTMVGKEKEAREGGGREGEVERKSTDRRRSADLTAERVDEPTRTRTRHVQRLSTTTLRAARQRRPTDFASIHYALTHSRELGAMQSHCCLRDVPMCLRHLRHPCSAFMHMCVVAALHPSAFSCPVSASVNKDRMARGLSAYFNIMRRVAQSRVTVNAAANATRLLQSIVFDPSRCLAFTYQDVNIAMSLGPVRRYIEKYRCLSPHIVEHHAFFSIEEVVSTHSRPDRLETSGWVLVPQIRASADLAESLQISKEHGACEQ